MLARQKVYGQSVAAEGPRFARMEITGATVRVWFHHAEGLRSSTVDDLVGFELSGGGPSFHPAHALIVDDHVELTAPGVPEPVHVRYAFSDTGEGNLENAAGLPALSFRTDTFPA